MRNTSANQAVNFGVPKQTFAVRLKRDMRKNYPLYIMFAPVLLYFLLFKYLPIYGLLMAFEDYVPKLGVLGSKWVGLKHFEAFFTSPYFKDTLLNTLRISLACLLWGFPAPIVLALMLNELRSARFAKVIQNITYMPHFISIVVACGLIHMFVSDTGVIGSLFVKYFGTNGSLLNYPKYFTPIYVISNIWQKCGWGSIIYLSALTAVDKELYEAAEIDGAGRWKQTLHITIPGILPTIVVMLILRMGNILGVGYEKILLLYNDATLGVADVISTHVYRRGLENLEYSYGAAVGMFNSVVNLVFLLFAQVISKKVNGYGLW